MSNYQNIPERNTLFNDLIRDTNQLQELITDTERNNRPVIRLINNAIASATNLIIPYQNALTRSRNNNNSNSNLNSQAEINGSSTNNSQTYRRNPIGGKSKSKIKSKVKSVAFKKTLAKSL
jgi:hypothetical protein